MKLFLVNMVGNIFYDEIHIFVIKLFVTNFNFQ